MMLTWVWFNGAIIEANVASLQAASNAGFYGRGIFTTVAIFGRVPFQWERHWQRLCHGAARLGLDIGAVTEASLRETVQEVIDRNRVFDGRVRITFFDESASSPWEPSEGQRLGLLVTAGERRKVPDIMRVTISPFRVNSASPLAGIKSCNYLENILAYEEAAKRGFHEAIRLNERGEVTGGVMSNLFWVESGKLFTPKLETGCLPGTTRGYIIEKLKCEEVAATLQDIESAEAIFLSSAGIGVAEADEFAENAANKGNKGKKLKRSNHEILKLLPGQPKGR